jgi:2-keto-4-pentenoate hydratase/2-oxohepta-3-ene-1,7-dioic acid hydratase in catechol pathway
VQLLAFARGGPDRADTRLGLRTDDGVIDLTDALGVSDVGELLARPEPLHHFGSADSELLEAGVELRAPIARPGKIICIGLNYHDQCREQSIEPPRYPMLFSKFANAVARPGAGIGALVAR